MPRLTMAKPRVAVADLRTAKPEPKRVDPFYRSPEWLRVRAFVLKRDNYTCQTCGVAVRQHLGETDKPRASVDHVVERRDGGADLNPANLATTCDACHTRKTNLKRAERQARHPS